MDHRRGIGGLCRGCLGREFGQGCAKQFAGADGRCARISNGPNLNPDSNPRIGNAVGSGTCLRADCCAALGGRARTTRDCAGGGRAGRWSNLGVHDQRTKDFFRQALRQQGHAARTEFDQHHESDGGVALRTVISTGAGVPARLFRSKSAAGIHQRCLSRIHRGSVPRTPKAGSCAPAESRQSRSACAQDLTGSPANYLERL